MKVSERIAELVTILDILHKYGYQTGIHNRIKCPVHDGKDKNFCYTDTVFHCWVCGAKGNCIGLVSQIFKIDYKQAVVKINNDFDLRLTNERPSYRDKLRIREITNQRAAQAEKNESGLQIYYRLTEARRDLYFAHGDNIAQVGYLDRLLDQFSAEPAALVDWEIDIENLILNLELVAKNEAQ